MKPSAFLAVFSAVACFLAIPEEANCAKPPAQSSAASSTSAPEESRVTIPGPLRSFLRMSGISQDISPEEVLPLLAHNVVVQGYERGRPTEFLVLLRRYVHQSRELSGLAGSDQKIHVDGCGSAEALLHVMGYRIQGECGQKEMSLITADAERAFLTIDSGFPLLDLEEALQRNGPFAYSYAATSVPVMFTAEDWLAANAKGQPARDVLDGILYEPSVARLYWALSRIEPETRMVLKKDVGLAKLLPLASMLDLYGRQLSVRDGAVVVPGGKSGEKDWREMVGANPQAPAEFIVKLLTKDHGWLASYFDAMARPSQSQQEQFAERQRMKRYYEAFRAPGASAQAGARVAFRPAPAILVLVTRLQWDGKGDAYVPGSLEAWDEIVHEKAASKTLPKKIERSGHFRDADQLAEAMFSFSRVETDDSPLQAYLYLSELDHRRGATRRLSDSVVVLMADKYLDFSDQYLIFSEFPELNDEAITRFLHIAEGLSKISDHTLRGNAMGTFQANVGIWQILARQGEIGRAQLNSTWLQTIEPFAVIPTDAQLVTAGRHSLQSVLQAATGKSGVSEDGLINALAGARQTTTTGQEMHREIANRIKRVLADQHLVSLDTIFALDDGLKNVPQSDSAKDHLVDLAGELREFEMPQPIFTNSERDRWAAGVYNDRHTEQEIRTDIAKVIKTPSTPKQRQQARGQLTTFLRDTLVGLNYAYYEPPGSQILHHNPLFVRSHDFSGDTVMGVEHLWQEASLFGEGSPAGGGAHLIGSLADLPYVLAETEQNFISPDHVQALIWQQFVPGVLSNATVLRWWNVTGNELHAVGLYQRAGEELLVAATSDEQARGEVMEVLSDRLFPEKRAWLENVLQSGKSEEMLKGVSPADTFYLTAGFQQKFPDELRKRSAASRELETLNREHPEEVSWQRLSHDFGVIHPVFAQSYAREFINVRPFPALEGIYSRLMAECWDSGNLYWARLADEMGYDPVLLNDMVPQLSRRMVERIYASQLEDWNATLRALRETGNEFRQGKITITAGVQGAGK